MLRTFLLFLLCLLLAVPQGAPASPGKSSVETSLPLNRTTFHFFSPEDIAANYKSSRIIRVGYFGQHGVFEGEGEHLSGYAVALLTAISRYTGWEYQWVKIRFDELAKRLDDGTIDLSCGISFTPERARLYNFSKLRAGYENTCLHVSSSSDIYYMDFKAFNGMRIGFFNDSLQHEVMKRFAAQNGFSFESLFFEESHEMSQALADGRIDGYVDGVQGKGTKVVATISTDPFFFVTRKGDNELMDPLNEAIRQIQLNHPTYLARLYDSYLNIASDVPVVFTRSESRWLATKPVIRVAYSREQDMMNPGRGGNFLYTFIKMLERQSGIRFELLPLPSYDACLKALAAGTADIMPDVYPKIAFLRSQGIFSGKPYYNAPITVMGRSQSKKLPGQGCTVGFTSEMHSVMLAYKSTYPDDIPKVYPSFSACRKAFEEGEVDVHIWPYPCSTLQGEPPKDWVLLPTRAMYPMALGVSPHASPFVISVLDKIITSTATATLEALLLSTAPPTTMDIMKRILRRNLMEVLCGFGLLLVLSTLMVIHRNKKRLAALRAVALTDPVTQGPNRARFLIEAAQILQKDSRLHYLCTINIRKLKLINRACGLRTGDSLIRFCNREFALRSRQGELSAYSGSGQYLLLWQCPDEATFTQRMEELFSVAEMARKLYQRPVSFSCGVYVIRSDAQLEENEPQPTLGTEKNINESERFVSRYLLYAETAEASIASGGYRSQFMIYNELLGARQLKANDIENRMVHTLERGEFTVFMQPQLCLADRRLHGAEALIRWQGPDGKMVYPDEFIPLFEQNGFIRELDLFVLDTVCAWIRRRLDEGKKVPPISINQSKALFFHNNYVETVLTIAARHDVPPHLLHVEVTESMAWLDEEGFIRTLDALRRAGIGLSLDDFGKGYSSMAMLHSFGFDTIKLDRAFLASGQDKQRSVWIIISSLVDMARRLGIEILCEGVETEEQLQKLLASHCKYGQGYLFSPPMNMETFDAYVDAHDLEQK